MTWNDRVIRTTHGKEKSFAIHEVYDDDDACPEARTERTASPAGETLEELEADLQAYLGALQEPVLEDAVFRRATGGLFSPEGDDEP